nr:MAG TPA: hypothetical protein [Caudoviricetes sp.]
MTIPLGRRGFGVRGPQSLPPSSGLPRISKWSGRAPFHLNKNNI